MQSAELVCSLGEQLTTLKQVLDSLILPCFAKELNATRIVKLKASKYMVPEL